MAYTKKQFLTDVAEEAKALKENATKEEINRLNFGTFDPGDNRHCIYGQITGNCSSKRAIELIGSGCIRYIENPFKRKINFEDVKKKVNGSNAACANKRGELVSIKYLSVIETYIYLPEAKPKNLIAYLKGERKDLVL